MSSIFTFACMTIVISLVLAKVLCWLLIKQNRMDRRWYKFKINLHICVIYVFNSVSNQACDKYGFDGSRVLRLLGRLGSSGNL